jgi:hypothetical protein
MDQQSIPNDVAALFKQANDDYAKASANTGEGAQGEWPPEGISEHFITDIEVKAGKFRLPKRGDQQKGDELDCVDVQFHFKQIPDDKSPNFDPNVLPLEWRGARFQILPISRIPVEGSQTRARIEQERLKGHCQVILGESSGNLLADVEKAIHKVKGPSAVVVKARVEYRKGKQSASGSTPIYKTEFLQELLSQG